MYKRQAFDGKPAGGLMEYVNLVLQSIFIEPVTEYLRVIWMQYAGVFLQFYFQAAGKLRFVEDTFADEYGTGLVIHVEMCIRDSRYTATDNKHHYGYD